MKSEPWSITVPPYHPLTNRITVSARPDTLVMVTAVDRSGGVFTIELTRTQWDSIIQQYSELPDYASS